jgi:hypothetical protein
MADTSPDELYEKAVMLVRARNRACTSMVQRTFLIGYNRAARLFDAMERAGIVSPLGENGVRTVLPVATPPSPSTAPEADPEKDFSDWMERRGALGAGAVPERIFFAGHSAGRRAALASRPAEVDAEGLPALPEGHAMEGHFGENGEWATVDGYTAEQYRQGQRDAVAADRARRGSQP